MTDKPVPSTKAGRALVREHGHKFNSPAHMVKHILAIEAEAVKPWREALTKIADLPPAMGRRSDAMELLDEAKQIARALLDESAE